MSENASKRTRGAFITAVFSMQGFGVLFGAIVVLVVSAAFPAPPYRDDLVPEADYVRRVILMFGTVPAALTFYRRMKMPETARYTALLMSEVLNTEIVEDVQRSGETSTTGEGSNQECGGSSRRSSRAGTGLHLVVTTSTWFLLDVAFFSQNLFQKDIFSMAGWIPPAKTMNAVDRGGVPHRALRRHLGLLVHRRVHRHRRPLRHPARGLPHDDRLQARHRRVPYHHWTTPGNHIGFVVMYGFTFFFADFGPNSTTFIVPAEIFPARLRSTCHGISAATGKVGAFLFLYAAQDPHNPEPGYSPGIGIRNTLFVLAGTNFLGMLIANDAARAGLQGVIARGDISKEAVADDEAA